MRSNQPGLLTEEDCWLLLPSCLDMQAVARKFRPRIFETVTLDEQIAVLLSRILFGNRAGGFGSLILEATTLASRGTLSITQQFILLVNGLFLSS